MYPETGVRSVLTKNIKQLIPSYVRVGDFNLPVIHRGQQKTCKICNEPDILPETVKCEVDVSYVAALNIGPNGTKCKEVTHQRYATKLTNAL